MKNAHTAFIFLSFTFLICALTTIDAPASDTTVLFKRGKDEAKPDGEKRPDEELGGDAICYSGGVGFLFRPPKDWLYKPEELGNSDACSLVFWGGGNFLNSVATMYPQTFPRPKNMQMAEVADMAADWARAEFADRPGGDKSRVRSGKTITTPHKLTFETRWIDDGPAPTAYEAIAYTESDGAVFAVVLSSRTPQGRELALPAFYEVLDNVTVFNVTRAK